MPFYKKFAAQTELKTVIFLKLLINFADIVQYDQQSDYQNYVSLLVVESIDAVSTQLIQKINVARIRTPDLLQEDYYYYY